MERLIEDANRYRESIGESSDLSIDSFADIVEAIQSVQEAQGIAGTTAKEAMTTIEGSANATKAAWENVLTAIAGGGDLTEAINGLIAGIFGENEGEGLLNQVIPRIQTALEGMADFISQAAPIFSAKFPELIEAIVPSLISSAISLVAALVAQLPSILSALFDGIVQGIIGSIPAIQQAFSQVNTESVSTLLSNVPQMLSTGTEWLINIIDGIIQQIPNVISTVGDMLSQMYTFLIDNLPEFLQKGVEIIVHLVQGIVQETPNIVKTIAETVASLIANIGEHLPEFLQKGIEIIGELITGLLDSIPDLVGAIPEILDSILNAFMDFDWIGIGVDIIDAIVDGIVQAGGKIWDTLTGVLSDTWDTVTGWFGFSSKSEGTGGGDFAPLSSSGIMAFSESGGGDEGEGSGSAGVRVMSRAKAATFSRPGSLFGAIGDAMANNFVSSRAANLAIPIEEKQVNESRSLETDKKLDALLSMCTEYFPTFAKVKVMLDTGVMVGEMLPDIDEGLADRLDFANAG